MSLEAELTLQDGKSLEHLGVLDEMQKQNIELQRQVQSIHR